MKINKFLNLVMFIMLVSLLVSCNSHKDNDNLNSNMDYKKAINENFHKEKNIKIQDLQYSNIIYFNFDKYDILPEYFKILDDHANFMCNNLNYKLIIEGHADARGTAEYNIVLGEKRANAVKMYLQSKGVFPNRIEIISYGKEKPAVFEYNEEAYAKNRRAVIIY